MFKIALRRVVDNVLKTDLDGFVAELYREYLIRFCDQAIEERRIDSGRFLPD
jgi:hypothetical protein